MSEEHAQTEQHAQTDHEHHIVSPVIYLTILLCLLFFTGLTVLASFKDLGEWHIAGNLTLFWNPVVALAIACTKMTLVVLFFMHVKYSTKLTKLTVISGFFIFLGLISMTLSDYVSRAWGRW
ncbi:MAG: cytochrome C oxidase subunit IV family protein [Terracidiphilus sp.]